MKNKLFLWFLFIINLCLGQKNINNYSFNVSDIKSLNILSDADNNKNVYIIGEKDKTNFILFDENFNQLQKISIPNEDKPKDFLGYSSNNSVYYSYWKKNDEEIEVKEIDFSKTNIKSTYIPFILEKKEKVLNSFNHQNSLYLLTVVKGSSSLNMYIFNMQSFKKKVIDCSTLRYIDSDNKPTNDLWDFLSEKNGTFYRDGFRLFKTSSNNINQVLATQKKKIYLTDKEIILSLDNNFNFSQLIYIGLDDFKISQKAIFKEPIVTQTEVPITPDTNSFLIDDKFFIINFTGDIITLLIKDLENNSLKKMILSGASNTGFENSELIEEDQSVKKRKILDKTTAFVRKATFLNPSISGYSENGNYYLTLGGVSYPQQNASMLGMFGAIGGIIGAIIDASHTSISNYSDKKIVYLKLKLNSNLEPVKESFSNSNIDNLRLFIENNDNKEEFLSAFEFQNHFILTSINKKEKKFSFYKF